MHLRHLIAACCLLTLLPHSLSADEHAAQLTIDRIYESKDFDERSYSCKWLPNIDGRPAAYTRIESIDGEDGAKGIVRYDAASGERTVFVAATDLATPEQTTPLKIDGYQWSEDLARVLIYTNTKRVWRQNTRGDYWVLDRVAGQLQKIGGDAKPSSLMFAKFSPDGSSVAFVRDGDVYVQDLLDGKVRRLTVRPNDRIINGTSDWVYEEEFGLRDAFRWSPDGTHIAYWQFDTSGVQDFTLINNTDSLYPTTKTFAYPKTGTRNSAVRIGVVSLKTAATRWVEIPGDPRDNYLPRIQWLDQTGELLIRQMNRNQNRETLHLLNFESETHRIVHTEQDDAWIDLQEELHFVSGGGAYYYQSDRDGWSHVYRIEVDDDTSALLTPGTFDVVDLHQVIPSDNGRDAVLYFSASPESASERYLYRAAPDAAVRRVTPAGSRGVHSYNISPDGAFAVHRYSNANRPSVVELVALPSHRVIRTLEDNAALAEKLSKLSIEPTEFFRIDIGDVKLDAWCIKPPDMDPNKKYPLLVYVYGEPAGSTVVNRWGGRHSLWHNMLAQAGYVVVSIDNRGTKTPRGREFRKSVYRKIGILGPNDQAAAVQKLLADRPYLDRQRVGSWGWSGGGSSTLHAIFRFPDLYKSAVAIAPVSNQRYYDTIYQERYMGLPSANVEGFRNGSPINFADQLKGDLLLIHGTADDNVHYQATELLINELIAKNKQFEMFVYPNRSHSIVERNNTRRHLMTKVTEFIKRTLPPGPR